MAKQKTIKHRFNENIENALANRIVSYEYATAVKNQSTASQEYEECLNMLSCERVDKKYDWNSDITTAKFTSLYLQGQGQSAAANFSTRDFVDVYIGRGESVPAANAEKRLINNTLNQRHLFYYHKLLRALGMKDLDGACYLRCWWEQKTVPGIVGTRIEEVESEEFDINGEPLFDRTLQIPQANFREIPVEGDVPVIDRFNFDVIDPRDIFKSSKYTYSLQDKIWTILRYSASIAWLEDHAEEMGFFNLDLLKNAHNTGDLRGKGTHTDNYGIPAGKESDRTPIKEWLIIERYGDDYALITDKGVEPGIDNNGNIVENAEKLSIISAFAVSNSGDKVLIRFQQNPYRSARGEPYIPLIRGLCYIHPSKDDGMGDGKCSRELQIAIDDTVNISNDAVMLSTMKTFIGRKSELESNDSIYMEPEHIIGLEDVNSIKVLDMNANIGEAMSQARFLSQAMEQVQAIDPLNQGPVQSATAEAREDKLTSTRNRFKELTSTNTMLSELYWMISQMSAQFAYKETLIELMGEDMLNDFNPTLEYSYKAVTSAIETEHSKNAKIRTLLEQLRVTASIENPKTPLVVNELNIMILELLGAEYDRIKNIYLDEGVGGGGEVGNLEGSQPLLNATNQTGLPQSDIEQFARGV